jgi:hypothetical protein
MWCSGGSCGDVPGTDALSVTHRPEVVVNVYRNVYRDAFLTPAVGPAIHGLTRFPNPPLVQSRDVLGDRFDL